jgi:hypothetical protein
VVLPTNLPIKPLRAVKDVAELLGETINQVRRGEIDLRTSNAIGYLSGILLCAIEKSSLEERLTELEAAVKNQSHSRTIPFDEETGFEFAQQSSGGPNCLS